jgi:hypothetical protein
MNLVEAESVGPVEGDEPLVTPPRPPHRRVSVSLLFTLTILTGTVVAIYATFPKRDNVLVTEAIERHHDTAPAWDLTNPTPIELRAWAIGVVGKDPPLPAPSTAVVGARKINVLDRDAALIRVHIGNDDVTYLVQRARGIPPDQANRVDGDVHAIAWRKGPFTLVAVGPEATSKTWRAAFP